MACAAAGGMCGIILVVKMFLVFMVLGTSLSLWTFFGQLFSSEPARPPGLIVGAEGMEMRTKVDLYLVELEGSPVPVLGDASSISSELPSPVDRSFVGDSVPGIKILEVLPSGAALIVTSASQSANSPVGLRGTIPGRAGEVDLSFIQDYSSDTPTLSVRVFMEPPPIPVLIKR